MTSADRASNLTADAVDEVGRQVEQLRVVDPAGRQRPLAIEAALGLCLGDRDVAPQVVVVALLEAALGERIIRAVLDAEGVGVDARVSPVFTGASGEVVGCDRCRRRGWWLGLLAVPTPISAPLDFTHADAVVGTLADIDLRHPLGTSIE